MASFEGKTDEKIKAKTDPKVKVRRFAGMRKYAKKVFRINQDKVLLVLFQDHPGKFDDVESGVCAALSCVWMRTMMNESMHVWLLQQDDVEAGAPKLFLGRLTYKDMARYLTNADVVTIQRDYARSCGGEKADDGDERKLSFWKETFKKSGLGLVSNAFPNRFAPNDFPDQLASLVDETLLKEDCAGLGVGLYVGLRFSVSAFIGTNSFNSRPAHAVAFFRMGSRKDGPLFFMDPNCGAYRVVRANLREFLKAWADCYENPPIRIRRPGQSETNNAPQPSSQPSPQSAPQDDGKVDSVWKPTYIDEYYVVKQA